MGQISILHISDIHFFEGLNTTDPYYDSIPLGSKWRELDLDLKNKIYPYFVRIVKKRIFDIIQEYKFDYIVISGDLGNKGSLEAYELCLKYLEIQFHHFRNIDKKNVIITAGNHDIFNDYNPKTPDTKFINFCNLLSKYGFNEYSLKKPKEYYIENDIGKLSLIDINTCLNYGEIDYHPEFLKILLDLSIETPRTITEDSQKKKYIIDQLMAKKGLDSLLDVPYVDEDTINCICKFLDDYSDYFPILTGHHNLLPMRHFLKDKPYNSIINGGQIREKLFQKNKTILYLHGHIHDDPLEGIISPVNQISDESSESKIICSSAPSLFPLPKSDSDKFGFNHVKIIFSNSQEKRPLGCEIKSFNLEGGNIVEQNKRIHFHDSLKAIKFLDKEERIILKYINNLDQKIYLTRLFDDLIDEGLISIDKEGFIEKTILLDWLKLIKLSTNQPIELKTIDKVFP